MDVLRFENSEYTITINGSNQKYAWERFIKRVPNASTYCEYSSSQEGYLSLSEPNTDFILEALNSDEPLSNWQEERPVLFETCKYQFAVEFKRLFPQSKSPRVVHPLKSINESFKFYSNGDKSGILVGTIDFQNAPGTFRFSFEYTDSNKVLRREFFELYVASPKLDTKNDLQKIISLINEEYENYVYEYLTLTFSSLAIKKSDKTNDIIWLSIFKSVIDDYINSVKYIMSRPNNQGIRKVYYSRPDKIRFWTSQQEEKYKNYGKDADIHNYRHEQIEKTINTKENRFVKYTLHVLIAKIKRVFSHIVLMYKDIDISEKETIEEYIRNLQVIYSSNFFKRIGDFEGFRQESIILQQRAGYFKIYKSWLILKSSLDLIEGKTNIGMKKIWELYEIWCFLVMKRLTAKVLKLDISDKRHIHEYFSRSGESYFNAFLAHTIEFENPTNGDTIILEYQRTINRKTHVIFSSTTEQRPDIVLTIKKSDGFTLTYLYDAKYRVLDDINSPELDDNANIDLADYPVPDAINQMHRYRDAIYYSIKDDSFPSAKEIIGGYILYPARIEGTKVENCYFYKSIKTVNIGAFPVLPANAKNKLLQADLLEKHLEDILYRNRIIEHVNNSIPQKGLHYITDIE